MADISMCINEECPLKENCYRYTAPAAEFWQAYGDFEYFINDKKQVVCDHYWDNSAQRSKFDILPHKN